MSKIDLAPAFLIHRRTYRDSSLLLDFLTRDHGKIRLIGKGARKSKTTLQMFQNLNICFSGRSDLKTLGNWEIDDSPRHFAGETLILCVYVNELIARLVLDFDPHPELFDKYKKFIFNLDGQKMQTQYWQLRIFEDDLLKELGYGLDYTCDIEGAKIDKNSYYQYHQNGFCADETGKISGILLNHLLEKDQFKLPDEQSLRTCRNLNRQRFSHLLGDKPLKSRELFFIKRTK